MPRKKICVVCKKLVDWSMVLEDFEELFDQVDTYGMESLTEQEQVVVEGGCCSIECFEKIR